LILPVLQILSPFDNSRVIEIAQTEICLPAIIFYALFIGHATSSLCCLEDTCPCPVYSSAYTVLWSPYVIGQTIIFSSCFFLVCLFLSSSFFSSPNLSGRRLVIYHTSPHGVALVRIYNAGLKCAARSSLKIQDAKKSPKIAISAPSHNFVGLYLHN